MAGRPESHTHVSEPITIAPAVLFLSWLARGRCLQRLQGLTRLFCRSPTPGGVTAQPAQQRFEPWPRLRHAGGNRIPVELAGAARIGPLERPAGLKADRIVQPAKRQERRTVVALNEMFEQQDRGIEAALSE